MSELTWSKNKRQFSAVVSEYWRS